MTDLTLFIYAESSIHVGAGTGLGAVDLPIQREQTTRFPMIQGSGVKGALRSQIDDHPHQTEKNIVFGPESQPGQSPDHAGCLNVGDARLLLFPVRSLNGVFAWVTCRTVLARFLRDCNPAGVPALPDSPPQEQVYATSGVSDGGKVVLEDFMYSTAAANPNPAVKWAEWFATYALPTGGVYTSYYQPAMQNRFVILRDDDFRDFVLYATQVVTRVALDDTTKTVAQGPFTVELLPAESLLYVPMGVQKPRSTASSKLQTPQTVANWLKQTALKDSSHIQIGGEETIGYGQVTLRWGK